jgi:hypothetical protein
VPNQPRLCPVEAVPEPRLTLTQAWVFLRFLGLLLGLAGVVLWLECLLRLAMAALLLLRVFG